MKYLYLTTILFFASLALNSCGDSGAGNPCPGNNCQLHVCLTNVPGGTHIYKAVGTSAGISPGQSSTLLSGNGGTVPSLDQTSSIDPTSYSDLLYYSGVDCSLTWFLTSFTVYTHDPNCPSGFHEYKMTDLAAYPVINYGETACGMTICVDFTKMKDGGCF